MEKESKTSMSCRKASQEAYGLIERQVSPDLQTIALFPSPLAGEGGWKPGEGYIRRNRQAEPDLRSSDSLKQEAKTEKS